MYICICTCVYRQYVRQNVRQNVIARARLVVLFAVQFPFPALLTVSVFPQSPLPYLLPAFFFQISCYLPDSFFSRSRLVVPRRARAQLLVRGILDLAARVAHLG